MWDSEPSRILAASSKPWPLLAFRRVVGGHQLPLMPFALLPPDPKLENGDRSHSPAMPGDKTLGNQFLVTDSIYKTHSYSLHF